MIILINNMPQKTYENDRQKKHESKHRNRDKSFYSRKFVDHKINNQTINHETKKIIKKIDQLK